MNSTDPNAPVSKFKRFLRHVTRGLIGLAVLVALFYAEENWRGQHAWQKFKREWEAQGVRFDLASIVPPRVPDDQNFAMTPLLAGLFDPKDTTTTNRFAKIDEAISGSIRYNGGWRSGKFLDLELVPANQRKRAQPSLPVRTPAAARALLVSLQKVQKDLDEITIASRQPYARFPVDYDKGFPHLTPHLAPLRSLARAFTHRACAGLTLGDTDQALEDILTNFRMAAAVKDEPPLMSHLIHTLCLNVALQPLWEGLSEHRWNEAQLAALEKELARANPLATGIHALQGERIMATYELERMARNKHGLIEWIEKGMGSNQIPLPIRFLYYGVPSGWFHQNLVTMNRRYLELILISVNHGLPPLNVLAIQRMEKSEPPTKFPPYNWAAMAVPAAAHTVQNTAFTQTSVDEAQVACALERFRLKNGHLPERLTELVPSFLEQIPKDVINGDPLKYRREAHDRFTLWSVGWNGKDEGGTAGHPRGSDPRPDLNQGDWVWPMPKAN